MKRDMDLVRAILLKAVDGLKANDLSKALEGEGYQFEEVSYHVALLIDAGFVEGEDIRHKLSPDRQAQLTSVTWAGHEFIDSARDDDIWAKAKSALGKAGGFSLPVMQQLLTKYLSESLGLNP